MREKFYFFLFISLLLAPQDLMWVTLGSASNNINPNRSLGFMDAHSTLILNYLIIVLKLSGAGEVKVIALPVMGWTMVRVVA